MLLQNVWRRLSARIGILRFAVRYFLDYLAERALLARGRGRTSGGGDDVRIAHVINPFICEPDHASYLYYAQPVTLESMRRARDAATAEGMQVELYAATFESDDAIVPGFFNKLPHLDRSTKTEYPSITEKELPFVVDLMDRLRDASDADYFVLTNTDICLSSDFYITCSRIIHSGVEAFVVNRRDGIPKWHQGRRLSAVDLARICKYRGSIHAGFDCFVFSRETLAAMNFGDLFLGYPPVGDAVKRELESNAPTFRVFRTLSATFHLGSDKAWKSGGPASKDPLWVKNVGEARRLGR